MNHVYWPFSSARASEDFLNWCAAAASKIGQDKLGNKSIKQHDIFYRCYQFTHNGRGAITNLRVRHWNKKPPKKGDLEMRNPLKMEHSFISVVIQNREMRTMRLKVLWKRQNQKIINILFTSFNSFVFRETEKKNFSGKELKKGKNLVPSGQSINLNASTTNRVTGFKRQN